MMSRYKPVGWRNDSHRHYLAAKYGSAKGSKPVANPHYPHNSPHPYKPIKMADESHEKFIREMAQLKKEVDADIALSPKVTYSEPTIKQLPEGTKVVGAQEDPADPVYDFKLGGEDTVGGLDELKLSNPRVSDATLQQHIANRDSVRVLLPGELPNLPTKEDWKAEGERFKAAPGELKETLVEAGQEFAAAQQAAKIRTEAFKKDLSDKAAVARAAIGARVGHYIKNEDGIVIDLRDLGKVGPAINARLGKIEAAAGRGAEAVKEDAAHNWKVAKSDAAEISKKTKAELEAAERKAKPFVTPYVEAAKAETAFIKSPQEVEKGWLHRASVAVRGVIPSKIAEWEVRNLAARRQAIDAKEIQLDRALRDEFRRQQVLNLGTDARIAPMSAFNRQIAELEVERAKLNRALPNQTILAEAGARVK
jgi:hypothetical protein